MGIPADGDNWWKKKDAWLGKASTKEYYTSEVTAREPSVVVGGRRPVMSGELKLKKGHKWVSWYAAPRTKEAGAEDAHTAEQTAPLTMPSQTPNPVPQPCCPQRRHDWRVRRRHQDGA